MGRQGKRYHPGLAMKKNNLERRIKEIEAKNLRQQEDRKMRAQRVAEL